MRRAIFHNSFEVSIEHVAAGSDAPGHAQILSKAAMPRGSHLGSDLPGDLLYISDEVRVFTVQKIG
jgi:hypothetical protein